MQIRQDFSKNLINVLQTGSSNLTLADTNEEAANSQALSTRQSIAVSALALANQSQAERAAAAALIPTEPINRNETAGETPPFSCVAMPPPERQQIRLICPVSDKYGNGLLTIF